MIWEVDSVEYQEALQDYEEVLASHPESWRDQSAKLTFEPLDRDGSHLPPDVQDTLSQLSRRPVAVFRALSQNVEGEYWADPSGGLVVEMARRPERIAGRHFVSSYFMDISGFAVFPSDATVCDAETPPRRNIRGADDLWTDVETGMQLMAEKQAEGVKTLALVDVHTTKLREEFYAKFLAPDLYKLVAQTSNREAMERWHRRSLLKIQGGALLLLLGVAAIAYALAAPRILLISAAIAVALVIATIHSWIDKRTKSRFENMSEEEVAEMLREVANRAKNKGMKP